MAKLRLIFFHSKSTKTHHTSLVDTFPSSGTNKASWKRAGGGMNAAKFSLPLPIPVLISIRDIFHCERGISRGFCHVCQRFLLPVWRIVVTIEPSRVGQKQNHKTEFAAPFLSPLVNLLRLSPLLATQPRTHIIHTPAAHSRLVCCVFSSHRLPLRVRGLSHEVTPCSGTPSPPPPAPIPHVSVIPVATPYGCHKSPDILPLLTVPPPSWLLLVLSLPPKACLTIRARSAALFDESFYPYSLRRRRSSLLRLPILPPT